MMHSGIVRAGILLFLLLPLVSGQCSTCLGGRCYDTGQCVLGCVPGYVNEYCDEACPSNCLNNVCHVGRETGTITCTDGCEQGYCGAKCTYPCPEGCETCDRQCGSCNVTLCPERHYGTDCKNICNPHYGKCDRETGRCIQCMRGHHGDNCEFQCTECFSNPRHIAYHCLSGCEVCRNQGPCPGGLFGYNCEWRCPSNCGQSNYTAERPCNRATGECSTGCVSGYHGPTCNYTCSEHCLFGRCNIATRECSTGCVSGYYGLTCNYTCDRYCIARDCNQDNGVCSYGCRYGYNQESNICEKREQIAFEFLPPAVVGFLVALGIVCLCVGCLCNEDNKKSQGCSEENAKKNTRWVDNVSCVQEHRVKFPQLKDPKTPTQTFHR